MGKKKEKDKRFEKFGTVSFTSESKVNDFIDYLEKGTVATTRCKPCELDFFPPRAQCPVCLGEDIEWFDITDSGKLLTFSRMKYGPAGFEDDLPYTIAVVQFDRIKVFGRISGDVPTDDIRIGMDLVARPNTLSNNQLNYTFHTP